jgi:TRAP-type mannitol/chloroaromatic compound transport system permease small subunit
MTQFINRVEAIVKFIGEKSSILNVVLVVLICVDVIQRYLFNQSHNWVIELEWHLFGLIFLLGSAFTLQQDKHVRVDVFYNGLSDKKKAIIDILGGVCLLLPMCLVGIRTCYNYASN